MRSGGLMATEMNLRTPLPWTFFITVGPQAKDFNPRMLSRCCTVDANYSLEMSQCRYVITYQK